MVKGIDFRKAVIQDSTLWQSQSLAQQPSKSEIKSNQRIPIFTPKFGQISNGSKMISRKAKTSISYIRHSRDQIRLFSYSITDQDLAFLKRFPTKMTHDEFEELIGLFEKTISTEKKCNFSRFLSLLPKFLDRFKLSTLKSIYAYIKSKRVKVGRPLVRGLFNIPTPDFPSLSTFVPRSKPAQRPKCPRAIQLLHVQMVTKLAKLDERAQTRVVEVEGDPSRT